MQGLWWCNLMYVFCANASSFFFRDRFEIPFYLWIFHYYTDEAKQVQDRWITILKWPEMRKNTLWKPFFNNESKHLHLLWMNKKFILLENRDWASAKNGWRLQRSKQDRGKNKNRPYVDIDMVSIRNANDASQRPNTGYVQSCSFSCYSSPASTFALSFPVLSNRVSQYLLLKESAILPK